MSTICITCMRCPYPSKWFRVEGHSCVLCCHARISPRIATAGPHLGRTVGESSIGFFGCCSVCYCCVVCHRFSTDYYCFPRGEYSTGCALPEIILSDWFLPQGVLVVVSAQAASCERPACHYAPHGPVLGPGTVRATALY